MGIYSRRQLTLLLVLVAAAGLGLAAGHWRRSHPELADRLERLDRAVTVPPSGVGGTEEARPPATDTLPPPRPFSRRRPPGSDPPAHGKRSLPSLDLNRATAGELARLPGVGRVLAARIVAEREGGGPFAGVDDLRRVRGLRRTKLESLREALGTGTP